MAQALSYGLDGLGLILSSGRLRTFNLRSARYDVQIGRGVYSTSFKNEYPIFSMDKVGRDIGLATLCPSRAVAL